MMDSNHSDAHIGDTESKFLPLFHDDVFRDFFWWFNERNGGQRLISADKSSKKLKIQVKMISIIRNSLKDEDKLKQFNECIEMQCLSQKRKDIILETSAKKSTSEENSILLGGRRKHLSVLKNLSLKIE